MKKLRAYYERELGTLHGFCREFSAAFPAQAHQLGMAGGAGDDPHIARFIQASALSNARIACLIDDNDSKFTEALLSVNYPHYVQPFPSAAIVCARNTAAGDTVQTLAAGTMMSATTDDGQTCRFRSAWDVLLAPVVLAGASYSPSCDAPAVSATIRITLAGASDRTHLEQLAMPALRVFIDAEPALCAAVRDALLMRAVCAHIELADGRRIALAEVPLLPAGFAPHEALVPGMAASHPALRLLTEYFAFPDKFQFLDIAWPVLARHLPDGCRAFTLQIGLSGIAATSYTARNLAALTNRHLVLGCTPVVNLFPLAAQPIEWRHSAADYPLLPAADAGQFCDIHSVTGVTALRAEHGAGQLAEFRPFYSLQHGDDSAARGRYYLLRRDPVVALTRPQLAMRIAFVDTRKEPLAMADASMSISLLCTNGDTPCRLRHGPRSSITADSGMSMLRLQLLRPPAPSCRFDTGEQWRLLSHLALSQGALLQRGASGLREILALYDLQQSATSQRQIAGIVALDHQAARAWIHDGWQKALLHGVEVRITLDEDAFAGGSLHLFAQVLDHFFGLQVHVTSFSQLTILSHATGKELLRCPPRNGTATLL